MISFMFEAKDSVLAPAQDLKFSIGPVDSEAYIPGLALPDSKASQSQILNILGHVTKAKDSIK